MHSAMTALSAKQPVREALAASHANAADTTVREFARYATGLYIAVRTNVGLSHAKVRDRSAVDLSRPLSSSSSSHSSLSRLAGA